MFEDDDEEISSLAIFCASILKWCSFDSLTVFIEQVVCLKRLVTLAFGTLC